MVAWWMTGVLAWLVAQAITALDQAGDIWPDSLLTAPDVTVLPQVIALADRSRWVVNTAYVLALVVAGIIAMTYESVQVRYSVKELAPRLIVGFVAANMAVPLCQQLLVIANALTQALADQSITGHAMIAMLSDHIAAATQDGATSFLLVLVTLLIVVLVFTLLFHWITRIGVLIILVAVAPVALACYALPQLEGAARFWWRTMLGALGTQVLQVVAVVSGLKVFLDPDVNLPVIIGLPATDVVNLLIAVVVLWTAVRIPALMRRYVLRGGGGNNPIGSILRIVVVQQVTRGLFRGAGRGAGRAVPTATGGMR